MERKIDLTSQISKFIATACYVGYVPFAPGTAASAVVCLLLFLLQPSDTILFVATLFLLPLGVLSSDEMEKELGEDSGHIVIDEVCGYIIAVWYIPRSAPYLIAAFLLFRLFDILKPPPIRSLERAVPGGAGVMFDDVLAGVFTNVSIQAWRFLFAG